MSENGQIKDLDERIKALKSSVQPASDHMEEHYSQAQLAWRMVIELVAGLGIGFGIGYGLDSLLGTMPIFLVIFIFLGLAAGIKTMMRSAQEVQSKMTEAASETEDGDNKGA